MAKKRSRGGQRDEFMCPDCGRRLVGRELTHDPTCPAARALDDLMVQDAAWFAARPDANHRCRWITAAERMGPPAVAGQSIPSRSVIHVVQLKPGIRARSLYVPGGDLVQPGAFALFGHPSTFALAQRRLGTLPPTYTGRLPSGLEARFFALRPGTSADEFKPEADGLVVIRSGEALPVPFS